MTGLKSGEAILSIGSNMGDKRGNIEQAVRLLDSCKGIEVLKVAGLYETEPVGYEDQDYFYNTCVLIKTSLEPEALLNATQKIENDLLRKRTIRWGPRTIDIDIIFYGDITMDTKRLTIPHPRYEERAFVLVPMMDLTDYEGSVPEDKSVRRIPWEFEV